MADQFNNDAKEQIRQAIDIVDLVGSYLALRREGRNFKALCPWHNDTKPSLQVNPARQSFKCWVCNIGGDIFSFIMKMEGIEFGEAIELLADRAGIKLVRQKSGIGTNSSDDRKILYKIMQWAEEQFHRYLIDAPEAETARRYFDDRGITEQSIERYKLGYSPDSWDWLLRRAVQNGFNEQQLDRVGLVIQRGEGRQGAYDRFRGRALFSIRDPQGRTVAFGGRTMIQVENAGAKYINSPETPLFSKHKLLYGLDSARDAITKSRTVLVMEGYTDCIMARQFGIDNCVAVLGTALGEQHLKILRQYCDRVVLVLDGDEAGQKRTNEILELFINEPIDLRVMTLPEGLDPCDFLIERGGTAFRSLQETAIDAMEHAFHTFTAGVNTSSNPHEAAKAMERVLAVLSKSSRANISGADAASNPERGLRESLIITRLARRFDMRDDVLRTKLIEMRRTNEQKAARTTANINAATSANTTVHPNNAVNSEYSTISGENDVAVIPLTQWQAMERELFELILLMPDCIVNMNEILQPSDLVTVTARALYDVVLKIHASGVTPEFGDVMNRLQNESLKSLLVDLDERATTMAKAVEPEERLREFLEKCSRDRLDRQTGLLHRKLRDDPKHDDAELLLKILEQEKLKRGIS